MRKDGDTVRIARTPNGASAHTGHARGTRSKGWESEAWRALTAGEGARRRRAVLAGYTLAPYSLLVHERHLI
jgi:hypothetical protein